MAQTDDFWLLVENILSPGNKQSYLSRRISNMFELGNSSQATEITITNEQFVASNTVLSFASCSEKSPVCAMVKQVVCHNCVV